MTKRDYNRDKEDVNVHLQQDEVGLLRVRLSRCPCGLRGSVGWQYRRSGKPNGDGGQLR